QTHFIYTIHWGRRQISSFGNTRFHRAIYFPFLRSKRTVYLRMQRLLLQAREGLNERTFIDLRGAEKVRQTLERDVKRNQREISLRQRSHFVRWSLHNLRHACATPGLRLIEVTNLDAIRIAGVDVYVAIFAHRLDRN